MIATMGVAVVVTAVPNLADADVTGADVVTDVLVVLTDVAMAADGPVGDGVADGTTDSASSMEDSSSSIGSSAGGGTFLRFTSSFLGRPRIDIFHGFTKKFPGTHLRHRLP